MYGFEKKERIRDTIKIKQAGFAMLNEKLFDLTIATIWKYTILSTLRITSCRFFRIKELQSKCYNMKLFSKLLSLPLEQKDRNVDLIYPVSPVLKITIGKEPDEITNNRHLLRKGKVTENPLSAFVQCGLSSNSWGKF